MGLFRSPRTLDFWVTSRNSRSQRKESKLEMARLLAILCLASVALAQDSIYSTEDVEPGQYVHNPEWDLTPYQLWKRKQAAKKGLQANVNSLPEPARKVVTVRKQKPKSRPAAAAPQQRQQSRFHSFQQVEQQRSSPAYQQQQQPRREQAYYYQPAFNQQTFQQPQQPQRAAYQQPAYQQQTFQQPQQVAAYPRAQHQTYTQEYIFEANNNAQRIYSYTAPKYQAKAEGESYSYAAIY